MDQLITSGGTDPDSYEFELYDISELENLKGSAGIISLIVYFSKS
jgi:hypothetical protein